MDGDGDRFDSTLPPRNNRPTARTLIAADDRVVLELGGLNVGPRNIDDAAFFLELFYKKHGYEVVCVIPDYPPGITEYTLTKRLG